MHPSPPSPTRTTDRPGVIFRIFLKLGLTSFGGPIAHLSYFREEFVVRRAWIDDRAYADLVSLCQFIPGPASSQVGFALGIQRGGGWAGGLAAWAGFTLPSALAMYLLALGAAAGSGPVARGLAHGLKLAAVAVVAQAVWGMARSLAPDAPRAAIALATLALLMFSGGAGMQVAAIAIGAMAGLVLLPAGPAAAGGHVASPISLRAGVTALMLCAALLAGLPLAAAALGDGPAMLFDACFRAGALVFGGGHVVLPLLQAEMVAPGWISQDAFLMGYGLAQAMPGPVFTFAAYLGAQAALAHDSASGAAVALAGIFLPGLLLVAGMLPLWDRLRTRPAARAAMRGANAAVVGLLAAALVDPVWTGTVSTALDVALAVAGFMLLGSTKTPPWLVVATLALAGVLSGLA